MRMITLTLHQRFLLFIKVLCLYVRARTSVTTQTTVRNLIAQCTAQHRSGRIHGMPLRTAVNRRLARFLGTLHWTRIERAFREYCTSRGIPVVVVVNDNDADYDTALVAQHAALEEEEDVHNHSSLLSAAAAA